MINTTWLWEGLSDIETSRIIVKSTEIFNKEDRIEILPSQIDILINEYKAKVHYCWNIRNNLDNSIFQITWESSEGRRYWKIILWNLQKYDYYFNDLNRTIKEMSDKQLQFYDNIIIEASGSSFTNSVNENFVLITNTEEIKYLLSIFLPKEDSYKFKYIKVDKDWFYLRKVWKKGNIGIKKKMYIKS